MYPELNPMSVHCATAVFEFFRLHKKVRLIPFPLHWDSQNGIFVINKLSLGQYWIWAGNLILVVGFLNITCSLFSLYHASQLSPAYVLYTLIFLVVSAFDCSVAWSIDSHKDVIVLGFNRMSASLSDAQTAFRSPGRMSGMTTKRNWKLFGLIGKWSARGPIMALAVMFPPFLVFTNMDPFCNLLQYSFNLLGNGDWHWMAMSTVLRFVMMTFYIMETERLYLLYVVMLFYWLEMQSIFLELLENDQVKTKVFLKRYRQLQLVCLTWESVWSNWICIMMCSLFGLITISGIAAVRFAGIIPWNSYWIVIAFLLQDVSILCLVIPILTECHVKTKSMIWSKSNDKNSMDHGPLITRRLKAARPISVKFGSSFVLTKQSQTSFFSAIVETTANGILV